MKLELTEHDILLLKLAGSALIAFLMIRFLVMPGAERLQENRIQNETLEETITGMKAAIERIPTLEKTIEVRREALAEASASYYSLMENRQVDELLTGIALKHGLFPVSLNIEGAAPAILQPYLYAAPSEMQEILSDRYMYVAAGRMVLSGDDGSLFAFLDDVAENYPAVRLRYLRRDERMYFDQDWNRVEQPDLSCELEVYMFDPKAADERPAGDMEDGLTKEPEDDLTKDLTDKLREMEAPEFQGGR